MVFLPPFRRRFPALPCGVFAGYPMHGSLKSIRINAPYFDGARLLIAADCTAYAYAAFHERFIKGHITLVGCPKLDGVGKDSFEEA